MKKNVNSKVSKTRQSASQQPVRKMQIATIAAVVSAITSIIAISIVIYQNKSSAKEKAPILSLRHVEVMSTYPDSTKLFVTVHNSGQRVASFKYAYTYVLNTSAGTAKANAVFTTQDILPNQDATWPFSQSKILTEHPNTYYCTKIWYYDEDINDIQHKELYYKLDNPNGIVFPASIPNNVLKLFKAQIMEYEKSALFRSTDS